VPIWMVVEDELDINDVILAMFEAWGIVGTSFADGLEAVRWVETVNQGLVTRELPELALIDIRLPEVSGPKVSAMIRRCIPLQDIGIVLTTAYRLTIEQEQRVIEDAQADALIYKPLPVMSVLREFLDDIVAKRRQSL
jgi:CheY-like chemotaxis protein